MKILALDSSGIVASVAVIADDVLLAEYTVNYKKTHSQTLLPMLDEVVKMTELDLSTIDAIAVAAGPGSFTGLRIGSATAGAICPILDARRKQVYTGIFRYQDHNLVTVQEQEAVPIIELFGQLEQLGEPVTFLGDGVPVFRELIEQELKVPFAFAPAQNNRQRAASVGALGLRYFKEGIIQTAAEHRPEYLRLSQAERERAEREKAQRNQEIAGE